LDFWSEIFALEQNGGAGGGGRGVRGGRNNENTVLQYYWDGEKLVLQYYLLVTSLVFYKPSFKKPSF